MENWFLIYAYVSAGLVVLNNYYSIFHPKEEESELLEEIYILADTLRVNPGWIIALLFIFLATFGWAILPIDLIYKAIDYFSKEK